MTLTSTSREYSMKFVKPTSILERRKRQSFSGNSAFLVDYRSLILENGCFACTKKSPLFTTSRYDIRHSPGAIRRTERRSRLCRYKCKIKQPQVSCNKVSGRDLSRACKIVCSARLGNHELDACLHRVFTVQVADTLSPIGIYLYLSEVVVCRQTNSTDSIFISK